jgi:hypothetical protein
MQSLPDWPGSPDRRRSPSTYRRQWRRQVRAATDLTEAPGAVPLLAQGGKIPVGGTIRTIGHRSHPIFTLPATACARHMAVVGTIGSGKPTRRRGAQARRPDAAARHRVRRR